MFELCEFLECFELFEYLELSENSERLENSENSELFENSENLELSENFEDSLYSDNGGLIYENVYNLHNVRVGGNYTSTHQHHPVYPNTLIPPNSPISPQISPFSHINSPTCVLPSYISVYLVISTLQIKYYVLSE